MLKYITCSDGPDDDDLVRGADLDVGVQAFDSGVELHNTKAKTRADAEHCRTHRHDVHQVSHPPINVLAYARRKHFCPAISLHFLRTFHGFVNIVGLPQNQLNSTKRLLITQWQSLPLDWFCFNEHLNKPREFLQIYLWWGRSRFGWSSGDSIGRRRKRGSDQRRDTQSRRVRPSAATSGWTRLAPAGCPSIYRNQTRNVVETFYFILNQCVRLSSLDSFWDWCFTGNAQYGCSVWPIFLFSPRGSTSCAWKYLKTKHIWCVRCVRIWVFKKLLSCQAWQCMYIFISRSRHGVRRESSNSERDL